MCFYSIHKSHVIIAGSKFTMAECVRLKHYQYYVRCDNNCSPVNNTFKQKFILFEIYIFQTIINYSQYTLYQTTDLRHEKLGVSFYPIERYVSFRLDLSKLSLQGVKPGPWCKEVKEGRIVTLPDGRTVFVLQHISLVFGIYKTVLLIKLNLSLIND